MGTHLSRETLNALVALCEAISTVGDTPISQLTPAQIGRVVGPAAGLLPVLNAEYRQAVREPYLSGVEWVEIEGNDREGRIIAADDPELLIRSFASRAEAEAFARRNNMRVYEEELVSRSSDG